MVRRALRLAAGALTAGIAAVALSGCHVGAAYGDRVWHDLDADGIQDEGEPGLAGVTVTLYCEAVARPPWDPLRVCDVARTDADGRYRLSGRPGHLPRDEGELQIVFEPPEGFRFTEPDAEGADEATDSDANSFTGRTRTLTTADASEDWDAGLVGPEGSIGDRVWRDGDGDGLQDPGEPGVAGVRVDLLDADGGGLATTATGADGGYLFDDLAPGTYRLRFEDEGTGLRFTPPDRGNDDTLDSDADPATGTTGTVEVEREESDPTVDAGLTSLGAIGDRVWQDLDGNGVQDAGEPGLTGVELELLDADGDVVATGQSGPRGDYLFTGLPAGEYRMRFSLGERDSAVFSRADRGGDDELDSDADPETGESHVIDVAAGEIDDSVDAGVVPFLTAAEISGVVWHDEDGDGIREVGEPEVEGMDVTLLDADGGAMATAQTSSSGRYAFRGLGAGDYRVRFSPPAGFGFTQQDAGTDDVIDSDADRGTGETPILTLDAGERDNTVGAGLLPLPPSGTAAIGDFVWQDNGNGIQDPGEPGMSNVTVELLAQDGTVLATTSTDGGLYRFTNLPAGAYRIRVEPPPGFQAVRPNRGTDDALDSDIGAADTTDVITLSDGETDDTVDAGLQLPS